MSAIVRSPPTMGGRAVSLMARRLLAVAWVVAAGCSSPPAPAPHEVRYRLTWDRDGVSAASDGGWEVSNDRGYHVHVARGWVASYSMELVECPKNATRNAMRQVATITRSMLESTAWAGHRAGTPNPAAIQPMQVESLTRLESRQVGAVTLSPQVYCQFHYLLARAGRDSPGLPADLDLVDTTLHVEGTFRAPGSTTDTPYTVHTASAYGQVFERAGNPPTAIHVDTGAASTDVEVRRHLGRMFDGVDFLRMGERAVALQILKALVDHADVEIAPFDERPSNGA